ncbi:MAG TPA: hypothetical protein VMS22_16120 [Candidatus Eisenbacteria bacterium]|nr:hypothetical protein [Candidatus Eisenbacteria bacterium]
MHRATRLILLTGCVIVVGATRATAQDGPPRHPQVVVLNEPPRHAQVVALDECDPTTFNPAVGADGTGFCHNVTLYVSAWASRPRCRS